MAKTKKMLKKGGTADNPGKIYHDYGTCKFVKPKSSICRKNVMRRIKTLRKEKPIPSFTCQRHLEDAPKIQKEFNGTPDNNTVSIGSKESVTSLSPKITQAPPRPPSPSEASIFASKLKTEYEKFQRNRKTNVSSKFNTVIILNEAIKKDKEGELDESDQKELAKYILEKRETEPDFLNTVYDEDGDYIHEEEEFNNNNNNNPPPDYLPQVPPPVPPPDYPPLVAPKTKKGTPAYQRLPFGNNNNGNRNKESTIGGARKKKRTLKKKGGRPKKQSKKTRKARK